MVDKNLQEKKKNKFGQSYIPNSTNSSLISESGQSEKTKTEGCVVCNKKKCYKYHLDAKSNSLSKKTPDDVVIQLKQHMLDMIIGPDYSSFCKLDPRTSQMELDIVKLHEAYVKQYENPITRNSSDSAKDANKPKIKRWLYRKIFLDEFQTFELGNCKRHLGDLRRTLDNAIAQRKKKNSKGSKSSFPSSPTPPQSQSLPQDYSVSGQQINMHGIPTNNSNGVQTSLAQVHTTQAIHNQSNPASGGYQPNLLNINVDSTASHPTPSLPTYLPQNIPHNIIFQQQQQPLNLQTSSSHSLQPHSLQSPPTGATPSPLNPLSLQPHPYYVSFGPMLPLHMSTQQHAAQQHFQSNVTPQQPQPTLHTFNHQHAMYQ